MVHDHGNIENVLVLQGGGSLGAFSCGVFKAFAKSSVKVDIVAGTSIGGVNAAIIAGSKNDHPEVALEQFWLELAENSVKLELTPWLSADRRHVGLNMDASESIEQMMTFYSSATYGNRRMFLPRWMPQYASIDPQYFKPKDWTYVYDHSPLAATLEKYIDYDKLRPDSSPNARLIVTAVNVLTAEPLTFDSSRQQITVRHLLGTSGYPLYGFPWVEVENAIYAWDGSLLSNTPLREAIDASPVNDKRVFIVENYPKIIDRLPKNLPEVMHRARDIMFSDKTAHNIRMSKVITLYLSFIEELYQIVEKHVDTAKLDSKQLASMQRKYQKIIQEHGAEIKNIAYITREEHIPHLYENTDFSLQGIKNLILHGEAKAGQLLQEMKL